MFWLSDRIVSDFVKGVRRVRNKFSQENFFVGVERSIVATILAVILFAFVTVIFLVPVSTDTFEAGTIAPTE